MKYKSPRGILTAALTVLAVGLMAPALLAQTTQPSIDELLNLPQPGVRNSSSAGPAAPGDGKKNVAIDPAVARRLTGEQAADAFQSALAEMSEASDRLGKRLDPGVETQRVQEGILAKLDQVIAAAQQQSGQSGKSSSSGKSQKQESGSAHNAGQQQAAGSRPGQSGSSAASGAAPMGGNKDGTTRVIDETRTEWGNLPPRLRDELKQGEDERFSPIYREMTERYYQGLAEEGK